MKCRLQAPCRRPLATGKVEAGFTLVELVISSAIMAIILTSAYACLQAGLSSRKVVESRADIAQSARVALSMMAADLRSATSLSKDFEFLGMSRMMGDIEADNLDFATHHYSPRARHEGDFCEVSYFLAKAADSDEFSLWRRRDPTPDPEPLAGGNREEIVRGIRALKFEYYDGYDWYEEWGDQEGERRETSVLLAPNLTGLPEAVRITLLFGSGELPAASTASVHPPASLDAAANPSESTKRNEDAPLVFQTVVRLNLAGMARTSSSATAAGSSTSNSGQPSQNAQ